MKSACGAGETVNSVVCVKQVPDTAEIKIDAADNTLIRAGAPSVVNPFDGYALELAARLKEKHGGAVTALCMGPEKAKDALRSCLAAGADGAYLVSDRAFAGSDTLATSYILSAALKYLEKRLGAFDIIFCGKQAVDGDTGQVGPQIAARLNAAQLTYVYAIELEDGGAVRVMREADSRGEIITARLPVVVTVMKTAWEPRCPSVRGKLAARAAEIPTLSAADLTEIDYARVGLRGSPTKVARTFTPRLQRRGKKIIARDVGECVKDAAAFLEEMKVI
jgi:electron transfer flavoprotein beta subunit